MKYQRKQEVVEADIYYRVGTENGDVKFIDAEEFEREFQPAESGWVVVYRYGGNEFARSGNPGASDVFQTESEAAKAAKRENDLMGSSYEYKAAPLSKYL